MAWLLVMIGATVLAQNPVPAKPQDKPIVIRGGMVHVGNGTVINNGTITIMNGKIVAVEDNSKPKGADMKNSVGMEVINASGKHVYPGFIGMNTMLGLSEIEAARATNDYNEVGGMNPNVRSVIAYNTDSKVTPTVRSNGVLLAQIVPQGGFISGSSSVVELDAWNWEDAAYKTDEGMHLNWPGMFISRTNGGETEEAQKERIQKSLNSIHDLFNNAKAYSQLKEHQEKNLKMESMRGLFDGSMKLYVHCNYIKDIISAVNLCKEHGLKMVLVGGIDAWRVTDLLKTEHVPVVLHRLHALPPREDEDVDLNYKIPYLLQQAGVEYCISVEGFWQVRNLSFNAGTAVTNGLTKEQALASITLNAAKILGIDKTAGTIETGKDATLIISDGDALDMKSNNISNAFIRGKNINLDNIQKQLYKKYMDKYGLKE